MTDEELIARGRELVGRRLGIQWELGELAEEISHLRERLMGLRV